MSKSNLNEIFYLEKLTSSKVENEQDPEGHCTIFKKLILDAQAHGVNSVELDVDSILFMLFLKSFASSFNPIINLLKTKKVTESLTKFYITTRDKTAIYQHKMGSITFVAVFYYSC